MTTGLPLYLLASLVPLFALSTARAGEFEELSSHFDTTRTLAGVHHPTTTNPDGTAINFWSAESEGALAKSTGLSNPHIAAADAYGNVYIADKSSHAILKITPDGRIHTFAGTHESGYNGDGPAPANQLEIASPNGLFVFPNGIVYLLDPGNHRIRRVDTNGIMTTVVNDPEPNWHPSGRALWVRPDEGLIYYTHEFKPLVVDGVPNNFADGAVVKQWTPAKGIELVCRKAVGFRNPANLAVNPVDGHLYVCDRAEEDVFKEATGVFRIDGPDQRTRMTGNVEQVPPADGQTALDSFIEGPRGIAFRADGSYFLCGHRNGSVWFVDTQGILHQYLRGRGNKDIYSLSDGLHPPLVDLDYFSQPRAVTLAPNGNLIVVANDSGFVFQVADAGPPPAPANVRVTVDPREGTRLSWTGVFGRGYRIERTSELVTPHWQPLDAVAGGAPDGAAFFVDPTPPTKPASFYRLLPAQ